MDTATTRYEVIISGGSYAGLSLSRALADALGPRARILVVEKSNSTRPTPKPSPRAFAISHASKQLLNVLGAWDQVQDEAQPVTSIEITDSSLDAGIRPVVLRYDNTTQNSEPASHIVPDVAIAAALRTIVAETDNIEVLYGASIRTTNNEGSNTRVTLEDGRVFFSKLVVAAEGRKSKTRDEAGIKLITKDHNQTGIVTRISHAKPHNETAVQHFLPAGPFAILPLPNNTSCITWTEDAKRAHEILDSDEATFRDHVDRRIGGRLGKIEIEVPPQSWPIKTHLARALVAPRLALIGDTARSVHPIAGQGLNLGLRDVAALTQVVAETWRLGLDIGLSTGGNSALARFERWRRFDSMSSAAMFDGINRLFANDNTILRSIRTAGLGMVDRLPPAKRFFIDEAAGLTGDVPRLLKGETV